MHKCIAGFSSSLDSFSKQWTFYNVYKKKYILRIIIEKKDFANNLPWKVADEHFRRIFNDKQFEFVDTTNIHYFLRSIYPLIRCLLVQMTNYAVDMQWIIAWENKMGCKLKPRHACRLRKISFEKKRETNTHLFDIKFIQLSLFVGFSIAFVIVFKNMFIELFKDSSGIQA